MDIRLSLMCGIDIPIPECQIVLKQPTIKEIAFIGETTFFLGVQCLSLNKNKIIEDESLLESTNNFQIFMTIINTPTEKEKKDAISSVCELLFPKYKLTITPRSLVFTNGDQISTIDENNFEYLQDVIRQVACLNSKNNNEDFNPVNKKAKEIADKLMRGRQRVAAQRGDNDNSVFTQYLSILAIGLNSISLQELMNLTMFQIFDLMERYSLYVNWDMDIRTRLAGGNPNDKPDNWMKNIH